MRYQKGRASSMGEEPRERKRNPQVTRFFKAIFLKTSGKPAAFANKRF